MAPPITSIATKRWRRHRIFALGPNPELRNQNYGLSLGGPFFKNKLFFFITYERQKFIAGNQLQATAPSDAWVAKAQALMSQFGVTPNPVMLRVLNTLWPRPFGARRT